MVSVGVAAHEIHGLEILLTLGRSKVEPSQAEVAGVLLVGEIAIALGHGVSRTAAAVRH